MIFKQIKVGGDRNFSYVIASDVNKEAIIIDPAYDVEKIDNFIGDKDLIPRMIMITHSHEDHTNGVTYFKNKYKGIEVVMNIHTDFNVDIQVEDEQTFEKDDMNYKFFFTPGHIKDHMCILLNETILFTGDLLFVGKIGGTGEMFPTSDAKQEWDSLQKVIATFSDDVEVWPGHDYGVKPSSTIGEEKANNPFLQCKTFEDFMSLKNGWLNYKANHDIK